MASATDYTRQGQWLVSDPLGHFIGTMYPTKGTQVAWMRNQISTATFSIPKAGSRWASDYVRQANRVEFHHAALPYPWIGEIADVQPSDTDVQITCQSAEVLYSQRHTDWLHDLDPEWPVGMAIVDLHSQAIKEKPIGIVPGEIDMRGPTYWSTFYLAPVSEAFTQLCQDTGGDWWVEKKPGSDLVRDPWLLRFAKTRGGNKWGQVMICGDIVDTPDYKKAIQDVRTRMIAIGPKFDLPGGDTDAFGPYYNRPVLFLDDKDAQIVYGLREMKMEFEAETEELLTELGFQELYKHSRGPKSLAINVDNRRSVWGTFWLGDIVRVVASHVDFDGIDVAVRVDGIQVDIDAQKMGLAVTMI